MIIIIRVPVISLNSMMTKKLSTCQLFSLWSIMVILIYLNAVFIFLIFRQSTFRRYAVSPTLYSNQKMSCFFTVRLFRKIEKKMNSCYMPIFSNWKQQEEKHDLRLKWIKKFYIIKTKREKHRRDDSLLVDVFSFILNCVTIHLLKQVKFWLKLWFG